MTIAQLQKLVAFAGAACACIVPGIEFSGHGGVTPFHVCVFESMVVPIVWAALSFFLLKNPWKDTAIIALVMIAASVGLGVFGWAFFTELLPAFRRPAKRPVIDLASMEMFCSAMGMLIAGWVFLLSRLSRHGRRLLQTKR